MITIKDFKPREHACGVWQYTGRDRNTTYIITDYTIQSVGRKYVKAVQYGHTVPDEFGLDYYEDEFLTERFEGKRTMRLFLNHSAALDYIEKQKLVTWFARLRHNIPRLEYTLKQLKAVKNILEPQPDPEVLNVGQPVWVLTEKPEHNDSKWTIQETTITGIGLTTVLIQKDTPGEIIEFDIEPIDLDAPTDQIHREYLKEHNPSNIPHLLFRTIDDARQYILLHQGQKS